MIESTLTLKTIGAELHRILPLGNHMAHTMPQDNNLLNLVGAHPRPFTLAAPASFKTYL